jgi:hypothetical protein
MEAPVTGYRRKASIRGTLQVNPPPVPDDLRTALAPPTTFGTKLFEVTALLAVATACKLNVKDAGDILFLRDWIFEELGPSGMSIIMLSGVEWDTLTDAQKELHYTMRASWLSSYSKASHSVLQHWFWKLFKDKTKGFAPLHKVFAKSRSTRPTVVLLPGRKFSSCTLSGHRCLHRTQAPCPWPQDVP